MKSILIIALATLSLSSFAQTKKLSSDCKLALEGAVSNAKEHHKLSIQFNLAQEMKLAQRSLDVGAESCILMAQKDRYSAEKNERIAGEVFEAAQAYIAKRGYSLTPRE